MGLFISLYVNYSSGSEAFVIGALTWLAIWGIFILIGKKNNRTSENIEELNSSDKTSDVNETFTHSSNTIVDDVQKENDASTLSYSIETRNRDRSNEKNEKVQQRDIKTYNRMSCAQLMKSQNSELQFLENPNNGKIYFKCGEIIGYVSPAVLDKIHSVSVDDLQYAEVSINESKPVSCLMIVDKKYRKVERTITLASQVNADKSVMKRKLVNAFEESIEEVKEKIDNTIIGDLILTSTIVNTYQSLKEQEGLKLICKAQNIDFIELLDEAYEEIKNRFKSDLP